MTAAQLAADIPDLREQIPVLPGRLHQSRQRASSHVLVVLGAEDPYPRLPTCLLQALGTVPLDFRPAPHPHRCRGREDQPGPPLPQSIRPGHRG
ncbi:hypothetical protein ACQ4WX_48625 [Streptomyces lasalocidi]